LVDVDSKRLEGNVDEALVRLVLQIGAQIDHLQAEHVGVALARSHLVGVQVQQLVDVGGSQTIAHLEGLDDGDLTRRLVAKFRVNLVLEANLLQRHLQHLGGVSTGSAPRLQAVREPVTGRGVGVTGGGQVDAGLRREIGASEDLPQHRQMLKRDARLILGKSLGSFQVVDGFGRNAEVVFNDNDDAAGAAVKVADGGLPVVDGSGAHRVDHNEGVVVVGKRLVTSLHRRLARSATGLGCHVH